MNRDHRAGIEPAHVIRRRPQNIDKGSRVTHGSQPLAGMAVNLDIQRFAVGLPETPADTVLAESLDAQLTMSRFHGLLNLLLKNP